MKKRKLITEKEILNLIYTGKRKLETTGDELFTPAAKDKIREAGIKLVSSNTNSGLGIEIFSDPYSKVKKAAIGSDHTGLALKKNIIQYLEKQGYSMTDVGTYDDQSCDYPDFAAKVGRMIQNGEVKFGILLDATGIPSAIAANKLKGIRAATCYNEFSTRSAREHNNANIIVIGAKSIGEEVVKSMLNVWLNCEFLGDRHQRRLDKIADLEK